MSGTLSSLNTALSALRYHRVAMDVSSSNIANVSTEGYSRRRVEGETVGAPSQPAMWSRHTGAGEGVRVGAIGRMVDPLLDARARREHGTQAYLDVRQTVLARVEAGIGEPGPTGAAAAMAAFRTSWQDLANNPGSEASRAQVLGRASTLADALRVQARNLETEAGDLRVRTQVDVAEVNTLATDLAFANRSIAVGTMSGTDVGALLDKRDQLAMRLSELTGSVATIRADGGVDVTLGGVSLVNGHDAGRLQIASGITVGGASDGQPVRFAIVNGAGVTPLPAGTTGEIGGLADLLNTTLPAYVAGLDAVATQLATDVNTVHTQGYDADGLAGGPLFTYNAADPAASLTVAITEPRRLAASAIPGGGLDNGNAHALAGATNVESSYQKLVNVFGTEVASVRRLATNQQALTSQVDNSREQLAGINLDEETVQMLAAQRAYEAAARVMTTLDSVLDTLINRTGLVR